MDVWVRLRTANRKTHHCHLTGETDEDAHADHLADIISYRTYGPTDQVPQGSPDFWNANEMTTGFVIKITGIPAQAAKRLRERYRHEVLNEWLRVPRIFRLCPELKKQQALNWLKSNYPSLATIFQNYFNNNTQQPYDSIPTVPWSVLRNKVWSVIKDRLATPEELEA